MTGTDHARPARDTSHECPGHQCIRRVGRGQLSCPRHWAMVPRPLQREVYAAYRQQPGGARHRQAMAAAIEAMAAAIEAMNP